MTTDPRPPAIYLWDPPREGRRGPSPRLSRARLVKAAVALADREGLAAVSMERVAQRLGMTAMALYRYVPGKAELVALMLDDGLGPPPPLAGGWRERLASWAAALAEAFRRHPWSIEASAGLREMGPNELAWLEAGMSAFDATRLGSRDRYQACLTILSVVRTWALFAGGKSGELVGAQWAARTRARVSGCDGYPQLSGLLAGSWSPSTLPDALDWVLDGIAVRLRRRP